MNLASLQSLLRSQAGFLASASAPAKLVGDLEALAESLTPFATLDAGQLAELVRHASHHRATGEWLAVLGKKPSTRKPAAPKKSAEDLVREAVQRLEGLYAKALDADFAMDAVDAEVAGLGKLTVAQLTSVAAAIGIVGVPKKKADLLAALARRIKARREFHDRAALDLPGPK